MKGRLFRAGAEAVMVDVSVAGPDLALTGDGVSLRWPLDSLESALGGDGAGHVVLTPRANAALGAPTDDGPALYLERAGLVAALDAQGAPSWFLDPIRAAIGAHRRSWFATRSIVLAAVVALLLGAGVLLLNAHELAVRAIPVEWETAAGRAAFDELRPGLDLGADPALQAFVEETGRRLLATRPSGNYTFRFHVLRDPAVNAYSLPGGDVIVTTGLLSAARTPDEVAAVVGHELGHVLERHALERVVGGVSAFSAIMLLFDPSGIVALAIALEAAELVTMKFSRDEEREADRIGLELVHAAGLDVHAPARAMEAIAALERAAGVKATLFDAHPAPAERARDLEAHAAELPPVARTELLTPEAWAALQAKAR